MYIPIVENNKEGRNKQEKDGKLLLCGIHYVLVYVHHKDKEQTGVPNKG